MPEGTETTTTTTAAPWHAGVDADIMGTWQNNGYDLADPKAVAIAATKNFIETKKFVGVAPNQLLKLPADAKDEAGWKSVWQRLGAPADPKEYDFSGVKHADGNAPDAGLLDAIRQAATAVHAPKDRAADLASAIVKHLDGQSASKAAEIKAKLDTEKADLAKNWGSKAEFNRLTAMQGAQRLGVDPETVAKLENEIGYAKVMEMFRKVGAGTSEDTFVEGRATGGMPTTAEGATARLAELSADKAWADRLLKGDAAARREFDALTTQIANAA